MNRLAHLLAGAAMLAGCGAASAQDSGMADPTRPPAMLNAPAAGGASQASGLPVVQSILVSERAGGRRIAVIDGKTLKQGDRVGGAVIDTIRATEVVLRRGGKRTILKLYRPLARVAAVQP